MSRTPTKMCAKVSRNKLLFPLFKSKLPADAEMKNTPSTLLNVIYLAGEHLAEKFLTLFCTHSWLLFNVLRMRTQVSLEIV